MSDLVCISYHQDTADKVLERPAAAAGREHSVIWKTPASMRDDKGKVHLKQAVPTRSRRAPPAAAFGVACSGCWSEYCEPAARLVWRRRHRRGIGALPGKLSDFGINDDFIKSLATRPSKPGTSAMFVLLRKVTLEKVLPEVAKLHGTVLKTSLTPQQDEQLRAALAAG